jgi:pimeloyl-ACP methyl ester carboxylesterase
MKIKIILLLLVSLLLNSCAFNFTFFRPQKLPRGMNISYTIGNDTTIVKIDTVTLQPTFFDKKKDTINFDYTIESVIFTSSNGNKLNGWLLKPKNRKIIGTLLHFHGSGANLFYHTRAISPLTKYGFQIFTFDYSGFGYSEGKATRETVLEDAIASFDYIQSREDVKKTKLMLYGQSYGVHLATIIGVKEQDKIDGMILEGGFTSHTDEAVYKVPLLGNIVKQGVCAKKEIKKFKKPVLIIHSKEDKLVPFYMGENIYKNANEPKEFYEVDKPHLEALQYYSKEISDKIKRMCTIE